MAYHNENLKFLVMRRLVDETKGSLCSLKVVIATKFSFNLLRLSC